MMTRWTMGGIACLVPALALAGCVAHRGMREIAPDAVRLGPVADQATIIFLRPARAGTTTSLFELRGSEQHFIGLLVSDTRLVYRTEPGRTRFMVIGLSADFLDADLAAGKTYQVAVLLGQGPSEQFFVLRPVRPGVTPTSAVQYCLASCTWLENTERSEGWARREASSIQRKKARYLPAWESRPKRPTLLATDGT
jgi:hypothetical protein